MRKIILIFIIFLSSNIFAQKVHYWHRHKLKYLQEYGSKKFVVLADDVKDTNSFKGIINDSGVQIETFATSNLSKLVKKVSSIDIRDNKLCIISSKSSSELKEIKHNKVLYESSLYLTENNKTVGISNIFYVKLYKKEDEQKLINLANQYKVDVLGTNINRPLSYILSCTKNSAGSVLKMANTFYETGLFEASGPDFFVLDKMTNCVNDTYFSSDQWNLENTGQTGGTAGIDIDICNAWKKTAGNNNVIIAVIDQGIDLAHEDLNNVYYLSWDAVNQSSPSQYRGEHGTCVAGVIGASKDNNIGVAGIAPHCPLMSISTTFEISHGMGNQGFYTGLMCSYAFDFARENGASVISNSWGHFSFDNYDLEDAIYDALTLGRGGLGCVVVFASGNDYAGAVIYPADQYPEILVVGSMNSNAERASSSNYGSALDLVAPGVNIKTTDWTGELGYDAGNYYTISGTSFACPHVAAVAALILSINPDLTNTEVNDIIESTSTEVGSYIYEPETGRNNGDWNEEVGYGLLNAYAALNSICSTYSISLATYSGSTYTIDNHCDINIDQTTIMNGANVTFDADNAITVESIMIYSGCTVEFK